MIFIKFPNDLFQKGIEYGNNSNKISPFSMEKLKYKYFPIQNLPEVYVTTFLLMCPTFFIYEIQLKYYTNTPS